MARLCSACFFPANRRQAGAVTGKIYKKHPRTRERRPRQCEQENTKRLKVLRSLLSAQNSRERRTVFPVNTGDLQAIYRKRLSSRERYDAAQQKARRPRGDRSRVDPRSALKMRKPGKPGFRAQFNRSHFATLPHFSKNARIKNERSSILLAVAALIAGIPLAPVVALDGAGRAGRARRGPRARVARAHVCRAVSRPRTAGVCG